jgi:DNA-binding NarL/FixJ family response regulator
MKQFLFSDDMALIQRWENILGKTTTQLIDDLERLYTVRDAIVIFNSCACGNKCDVIIDVLISNNNKVLILDRVPDFYKAQKWLAKGIKGYGNAIMTSSYLLSAIEAISKELVWLIPDITTAFVNHLVKKEHIQNNNEDKIYNELTKKEQEIAKLLKEGYTNSDISTMLDVSLNTVKTHVKHIYKKLQVKDRISFSLLFNK